MYSLVQVALAVQHLDTGDLVWIQDPLAPIVAQLLVDLISDHDLGTDVWVDVTFVVLCQDATRCVREVSGMGCSKSNRGEAQEGDRERAEEMHIVKVARNCLEIGVQGQYLSHMRFVGGCYLR